MTDLYPAVRVCALALLGGEVLQASKVSAGRGTVIDWRHVKSGEIVCEGDAFDTAHAFVTLVGEKSALSAAIVGPELAPLPHRPEVTAWMRTPSGRGRSFDVGPYHVNVHVSADEDDAAHAAFTEKLAALAASALNRPAYGIVQERKGETTNG